MYCAVEPPYDIRDYSPRTATNYPAPEYVPLQTATRKPEKKGSKVGEIMLFRGKIFAMCVLDWLCCWADGDFGIEDDLSNDEEIKMERCEVF